MTNYSFHTDPSHGWLEVPIDQIEYLGIADQISNYSYIKGQMAYLEEDCDAGLFLRALEAKGEQFTLKEISTNYDSFIRALPRFTDQRVAA